MQPTNHACGQVTAKALAWTCQTVAMQVVIASEQEFASPRGRFDFDVDELIARVPATSTTKGMFFNRCLSLAKDHDEDELLRAAGIEERRFVPFTDYPWAQFIRLAVAVAKVIGNGSVTIGLREVGRALFEEFADSLVGHVTFGVLRNNADKVIGLGAKAWNMAGIPGRVHGESCGDRHYRYHFLAYPAELTETVAIGVLDAALRSCGEVPRLRFARANKMNSVVDIRWAQA